MVNMQPLILMTDIKEIKIEKITLNIGAGKDPARLEKAVKLIKHLTGKDPVKTITQKRLPAWGLRPGLPIGCKLTLRDKAAIKNLLTRFLKSKGNKLSKKQFDHCGNVSFGIHEYIDIPEVKYNPEIGIMGLQMSITLTRAGMRVRSRSLRKATVPVSHRISQEEAIAFMRKMFSIEVDE